MQPLNKVQHRNSRASETALSGDGQTRPISDGRYRAEIELSLLDLDVTSIA